MGWLLLITDPQHWACPSIREPGCPPGGVSVLPRRALSPADRLPSCSPQACRDFLELAETHSRKWQRTLQYEREQRIHLEETIEQLAKQHNNLERACRGAPALTANTVTHVPKGQPPARAAEARALSACSTLLSARPNVEAWKELHSAPGFCFCPEEKEPQGSIARVP